MIWAVVKSSASEGSTVVDLELKTTRKKADATGLRGA